MFRVGDVLRRMVAGMATDLDKLVRLIFGCQKEMPNLKGGSVNSIGLCSTFAIQPLATLHPFRPEAESPKNFSLGLRTLVFDGHKGPTTNER